MIRITPHNNMPSPRATGRTFRRLLRALLAASEGQHVTYVVQNGQMANWTFNRAMNMLDKTLNYHHIKAGTRNKIEFPNGSLEFVESSRFNRDARGLAGMQFKVIRDED